ncbi:unnamed protein product [Candida verbasci]|uniref:SRP9 domain-containing protein n=1 Tax=Candida verbasci TaxID=1227364 RepID=A0A9W4TWG3_9ASCO|nr:unnamed protein product [Candida verbasci]
MPKISNIDKFIELSSDLLSNYPSTTLSITYTSKKKSKKTIEDDKISKDSKKASNSVNFKLYEPHSGKCLKFNTSKSKELSKLLNFIGPRGVSNQNQNVIGLASLMTNVKYEDKEQPTEQIDEKEQTPIVEKDSAPVIQNANATSSSSKKKKKNKKKKN